MTEAMNPLIAPTQAEGMSRNALDYLESLHGLAVYQELQWLEEIINCCEVRNRYKISVLPEGAENRIVPDHEFENLPALFKAREDSTVCCRFCCANNRALKLGLFPPSVPNKPRWPETAPMLTMDRPFKCTIYCCCCIFQPQELSVYDSEEEYLGKVVSDYRCFDCCFKCQCWAKSFDPNGRHNFSFKTKLCGENCCAPTCFNQVFTIYVLDPETERNSVGVFKNIFPGWNWRGLGSESADNFIILFPPNATKEEKGLLLGSLFLHDFLMFEKKKNNNNG